MKISYETYHLDNGMQIILIPSKTTYSVTISALIKSGSAMLESKKNEGITHMIEHLSLFSGTKKWPEKSNFIETTEFNGASFNGSTSKEILNYYINVPYSKVEYGLEFIDQILYRAKFDPKYVSQERTVIRDEIERRDDNIANKAYRFERNLLLKKKSPYIFEISGSKENVESIQMGDLKRHYKLAHDPSRVVLSLVGNFKIAEAKKLIDKYFSKEKGLDSEINHPEDEILESNISVKHDEKANLIYGSLIFKGMAAESLTTNETITLDVIRKVLSGPFSSRLVKRLREKEGLLYHIHSDINLYQKFGYLGIFFKVVQEKYLKTLKIVNEEIERFYEKGVTQKELDHFKEYIINRNLVTYDNIYDLSRLIRTPIFYNADILTLEEINRHIKSLTADEINKKIRKIYIPETMNAVAYGNIQKNTEEDIRKVLKRK